MARAWIAVPYSAETIAYAAGKGIAEDELPLIIDGCSGGISWIYAIGGKAISCQECCNRHDIDYQFGAAGGRIGKRRISG